MKKNNMKTKMKLTALLAALMMIGCAAGGDDFYVTRNIVYFVDSEEFHTTLNTEHEWDELLEVLLDYTVEGKTVMFYNADYRVAKAMGAKGDVTYRTRDRQKMRDWCKKMECEGMTVTITYDRRRGEWTGVASNGRRTNK